MKAMRKKEGTGFYLSVRGSILPTLLATGLVLAFLLSSCTTGLSAERGKASELPTVAGNQSDFLDKQQFVRTLITCISDTTQTENVYRFIPAAQRNGVTYPEFAAYIDALSRFITGGSSIQSYRFLSNTEKDSVLSAISDKAPDYAGIIEASVPVELIFQDQSDSLSPIYLFYQQDANQTPYLSSDWVQESMRVFSAADLYFSALESKNENAVSTLLSDSASVEQESFSDTVLRYKANQLIQYYNVRVQTPYSGYRLLALSPASATFLQSEVLDDSSSGYESRVVNFLADAGGKVLIRDNAGSVLSSRDLNLYVGDNKSLHIGDYANSSQFTELFGQPMAVIPGQTVTSSSSKTGYEQQIVVSYADAVGLSATIQGSMSSDGSSWEGKIIRIRLRTNKGDLRLGARLYAGMKKDDVLMLYPFADASDYVLSSFADDTKYSLTLQFAASDPGKISGIVLEEAAS